MSSMTADISAFARAYHSKTEDMKVFDDTIAGKLLTEDEFNGIAKNMVKGIKFFFPDFNGNEKEALNLIANTYLCPSPVGRAAFASHTLHEAEKNGIKQILILAAGLDGFAYSAENNGYTAVFEADYSEMLENKQKRLADADIKKPTNTQYIPLSLTEKFAGKFLHNRIYSKEKLSFCTALGVFYYLTESEIKNMLYELSEMLSTGSKLVFDYQDENTYTSSAGIRTIKQNMLAQAADEKMKSSFSEVQLADICRENGFVIEKLLVPSEITALYFSEFNKTAAIKITAFDNVNYCCIKKV